MDRGGDEQSWIDTFRDLANARPAAPGRRPRTHAVGDAEGPWLENPAWRGGPLRSTALVDVRFVAFFATVWMTLTAIIVFPIPHGDEPPGIDVMLMMSFFPLFGIAMFGFVGFRLHAYRRFGAMPLTLVPFPARIGGRVTGRIDVPSVVSDATDVRATLTLVRRLKGQKSTVEKPVFDVAARVRTVPASSGPVLEIVVDVPDELPASTLVKEGASFVWSIVLESTALGLSRRYEIPAYDTEASMRARVGAAGADGVSTTDRGTGELRADIPISARQRVVVRRMVVTAALLCSAMWFRTILFPWPERFGVFDAVSLLFGVVPLLLIPHMLRRIDEMPGIEEP